ncbi:MAG TPA: mechanosensitive ion channel [Spirochaetes bacterium]|nr:mechanosensitive ion channel [Spirochaetota bacterium]
MVRIMYETLRQFLFNDILTSGDYGISVLDIALIIPIIVADFFILRILNRFTKKKGRQKKGYLRTVTRVIKWAMHFLAFLGTILVLGVRITNVFDFIFAVLNFKLFTLVDTHISLFTIIIMVVVIYASTKLSKLVRNYFHHSVFQRFNIEEGLKFSLSRFIGYLIIAIGIIIALQGFGIRLSALTVFAGVLGVGIGFGMQNITANIVSGIVILFERPVKVGDIVKLNNMIGEVTKINLRASIIRTIYNEHLIVPNTEFINHIVENMSYGDLKLRICIKVGVAYGTDVDLARDTLLEAARATETVMNDPPPVVLFRQFGDSSLDFELFVWIDNPQIKFNVESDLHFMIVKLFDQHGIEIPFPQRDVYIKEIPG